MSILAVLLVCTLATQWASSSEISTEETAANYRLPNSTVPKHYDLKLWTNGYEGNASFRGLVKIFVDVVEPTGEVILHALNLTVTECRIFRWEENGDQGELSGLKVDEIEENEQLKVSSSDLIEAGSYVLQLEFNGTMNVTYPEGLFLTTYKDGEDSERFIMATHLSPFRARRAFPCFDEPALKATFNISVVHHKNHEAYSNMPLIRREIVDEKFVESSFDQTPKMSTYILIICTTDFAVTTVGNQMALVRNSLAAKAEDSLQIGQEVLEFMDKYTNLKYSDYIPKLGHLAFPLDMRLHFSAMENWGLIWYLEKFFIESPTYYNLYEKNTKFSTETIVHEIVHQWFGNLVTPQWWNHVWLSEGMATLYQYYILDQIRPSERWMDSYLIDGVPRGLRDDDEDVKPISFECINRENITLQFGTWTYEKAAGVLNMFRTVLGDEKWQNAIRIYLKSRLLNSATPDDLFSAIEAVSKDSGLFPPNYSVKEIFDAWLSQEGAIILIVKRLEGSNDIILFQQRQQYCTYYKSDTHIIPFNFAYESSPNFQEMGPIHWLTSNAARISTNASYDEWIIFNKGRFGMYKINYDPHNWRLIIQALHKNVSSIPYLNRAQLLDDALDSYKQERIYFDILFQLTTYLRNETDLLVWSRGKEILDFIRIYVQGRDNFKIFKTFQTHLIEPIYRSFQPQMKLLPLTEPVHRWITNMACLGGIRSCLDAARSAFSAAADETNSSGPPPPEEMYTVYCFGMKNSTEREFSRLLNRFRTSRDSNEQDLLLSVLLFCTDGVDRTRKAFAEIRDYYKEDENRSKDLHLYRFFAAKYRVVEDKLQQLFEILSEDSEFVENLGIPLTKLSINHVQRLIQTKEESVQAKLLLKKFRNLLGDDKDFSEQYYDDPLPNHDSVAIEYFLKQYVNNLK